MSEKRYIKLFLTRQAGKKPARYEKLFDAMARQKKYDEESIRHELKKDIKYFRAVKYNLYAILLRCLRLYHSGSSADNLLYNMLHTIEILYDKGLYVACASMIKKAEKTALLHEKQLAMLELLGWESRVMMELGIKNLTKQNINRLSKTESFLLAKYKVVSACRTAHRQIFQLHFRYVNARSVSVKRELDTAMKNLPLYTKQLPMDAKIYMLFACVAYYSTLGDFIKSQAYCKKLIQLLESVPHQLKERQQQYISALLNMGALSEMLRQIDECDKVLQKVKAISPNNDRMALIIFEGSYAIEFGILHITGQFEKALQLVEKTKTGIQRFGKKISVRHYLELCYMIAWSYFGAGRYHDTIKWTNILHNKPETRQRNDIYIATRLLHLMAHIEKGNWNFAGHLSRHIQQFLRKEQYIYHLENKLLDFIRTKLSHATSSHQVSKLFEEFKPKAEKILKDSFQQKVLHYIDFPSWLDSKIQSRPFAEVVREKAEKQQ